MSSGNITASF